MKRFVVFVAAVLLMMIYGNGHAWGVFAKALKDTYGLLDWQTQFIFTSDILASCSTMIFAGWLHDRLGPRPLVLASAFVMGGAYLLAWQFGDNYWALWLAMGPLLGAGGALGYVCPIATVIKWFPNHKGLACGAVASGYAVGAILLIDIAQRLIEQWQVPVLQVFGYVGFAFLPALLVLGLILVPPPGQITHESVQKFRWRHLARDRRFWLLFAGMFCGTMPYLVVMGNVKLLGTAFAIGPAAVAIVGGCTAAGSATGRMFWGFVLDRLGQRRSTLAAMSILVLAIGCLMLAQGSAEMFLAAVFLIGFCYGSNFSIYPATVARIYGPALLGSIYPLIMFAQGISSLGSTASGKLKDATGSYMPGLIMVGVVGLIGLGIAAMARRER